MRNYLLAMAVACMFAAPLVAQEPSFVQDYMLETTSYGTHFVILGNTLNSDFVVFYDHYSGSNYNLKTVLIHAGGGPLGAVHLVSNNVQINYWFAWDAAWHPKAKRYVVVYKVGNKLYARAVGVGGAPLSAERFICNYDGNYIDVTWAAKNKFVVFLQRDGQLVGQALRKNARKYKGEKQLVSLETGVSYPLDAASEEDGTAVAYYARYWVSPGEADICVLRVDEKLNILDDFDQVSDLPAADETFARFVRGNYDPVSKTHSVAYRIGAGPARYTTFKKDGTWVSHPKNLPTDSRPWALLYDPVKKRFAVFYFTLNYYEGKDHAQLYLTVYKPNGKIVSADNLLKVTDSEIDALGCGFNKTGKTFLGWVNDGSPVGVLGRLIY
jgi:hypothetical protein